METERLHLRLIQPDDADFLHQLMDNAKWHEMIGDRGVYSRSDALKYMEERMDPDLKKKGFVNHVMIEKATGELVGTCSLHDREGVDGIDIGYALLPQFEGKGYATEGAKAMVELSFNHYELDRVSAITTTENVGSCRVLERLGFVHKGYVKLPDSDHEIRLYIIEKRNWA
ncbi:GNAT family N-acetyltransferase [Ekhidna sp. To15]|uniref:GNAT family N-acetyltransferase n=1 Tax=Ekhidna sp. To15 TaxID=3395267 RepID=UPI003F526B05